MDVDPMKIVKETAEALVPPTLPKPPTRFKDAHNRVFEMQGGTLVQVGQIVPSRTPEGVKSVVVQASSKDEPATKKDRKRAKAGLPYRGKDGRTRQ